MAAIETKQAQNFVDNYVRPLAESIRALKVDVDDALREWNLGINATFTADAKNTFSDGRAAEGLKQMAAGDITNLMAQAQAIQTLLNQAGVADVIQKPCVRKLQAS